MIIRRGVYMQSKASRSHRYVHIIFLWLTGLILGMLLFHLYRQDFQNIIRQFPSVRISIFALLLSSFLPLILTVVVLRQAIFCVPFIFAFVKAFLYGFSLMIYSGAISGLFLFSQTCSCFLLLLLIFIQICRPKFLSFRLCLVFLTVDLILIILDYTVICPMYF